MPSSGFCSPGEFNIYLVIVWCSLKSETWVIKELSVDGFFLWSGRSMMVFRMSV